MEGASRRAGNTTKQDDRAACAVAGGFFQLFFSFKYSLASHSSIACQTRAFFFVLAENRNRKRISDAFTDGKRNSDNILLTTVQSITVNLPRFVSY